MPFVKADQFVSMMSKPGSAFLKALLTELGIDPDKVGSVEISCPNDAVFTLKCSVFVTYEALESAARRFLESER